MNSRQPALRLDPSLDWKLISSVYAQASRIHIQPFLAVDCAEAIYRCLTTEIPWQLHFNVGDRPIDLPGAIFDELPQLERSRLLDCVHASAGQRFQYLFNNFPISDVYERGEQRSLYLMRLYEFLNSAEFLEFARHVTGVRTIAVTDAQATLYLSGHFLAHHDDLQSDKKRVAAYVLNFTPQWVPDWGGILQFIAPDGHITEGYTPTFNALNLFRVPQLHSVSYIAPFAQAGRYSITGWLREA